jgi:uncharacterized metal-binding protein
MLVATLSRGRLTSNERLRLEISNFADLVSMLSQFQIGTVVCGGIRRDAREILVARGVDVVDNVAGSAEEVLRALELGALRRGYGLSGEAGIQPAVGSSLPEAGARDTDPSSWSRSFDCLQCSDRLCLRNQNCLPGIVDVDTPLPPTLQRMLEATTDVAGEKERTLCRLSELIYFCLEMGFRRLGIAYCVDLDEPTRILTSVLERFFDVVPVCCKIGGVAAREIDARLSDSFEPLANRSMACNPLGQARVLNATETDLNLIVGLCVGADCVVARESEAPVTTLFVKDKSLANNPIGALYSEYYLRESAGSDADISGSDARLRVDRRTASFNVPGREGRR